MDFSLPEDITALKDSVARFATTEILPSMPAYEDSGAFPHLLVEKMGAAGFFGAAFPEALGGSEAGFLAVSGHIRDDFAAGPGIRLLHEHAGHDLPLHDLQLGKRGPDRPLRTGSDRGPEDRHVCAVGTRRRIGCSRAP